MFATISRDGKSAMVFASLCRLLTKWDQSSPQLHGLDTHNSPQSELPISSTSPVPTNARYDNTTSMAADDGMWEAPMELSTPLEETVLLPDSSDDEKSDNDEHDRDPYVDSGGEASMDLATPLNSLVDLPEAFTPSREGSEEAGYESEAAFLDHEGTLDHERLEYQFLGDQEHEQVDDHALVAQERDSDLEDSPTFTRSPSVTLVPGMHGGGVPPFWVPLPVMEMGTGEIGEEWTGVRKDWKKGVS
jgi:hypothetical protein